LTAARLYAYNDPTLEHHFVW